jgi:1,2-diacylglycerol 3-beta-galactosyltransferase
LHSAAQAISQARLPVQLLIVTGRNKRLYMRLQRVRASLRVPAKIFGFVHNMPEMMRASDVIITKAGPGTICEALACDLPIILSDFVPGQEEGNVTFVTENKVGTLAYDSLELINILRRLIKPGSPVLRQQIENARQIARPYASFDIAACILSFLPPAGAAGVWQQPADQRGRRGQHITRARRLQTVVSTRLVHARRRAQTTSVKTVRTIRHRLRRFNIIDRTIGKQAR